MKYHYDDNNHRHTKTVKVHRITEYGICIKISGSYSGLSSYRWIYKEDYSMKLTLDFSAQRNVSDYEFAVKKGQKDQSKKISSKQKRKFSKIEDLQIPCSALLKGVAGASFLGVYVQRRSDTQCTWGRLTVIKYPVDIKNRLKMTVSGGPTEISPHNMLDVLQKTDHEIMEKQRFLKHFGLNRYASDNSPQWASQITSNSLLFSLCRYRCRYVVERLIVELQLFSTEWVQSILDQKNEETTGKKMLYYLVENRRISRLHDHYRVHKSQFSSTHCSLLYVCTIPRRF